MRKGKYVSFTKIQISASRVDGVLVPIRNEKRGKRDVVGWVNGWINLRQDRRTNKKVEGKK